MSSVVERVQTGLRIEKRTLKVLKALAEYLDLSLGDLLEGIVLHAFEGVAPFGAESLAQIARLKSVYGLTLTASDSHVLIEADGQPPTASKTRRPSTAATKRKSDRGRPSTRASRAHP
jgi:hypothetical protein